LNKLYSQFINTSKRLFKYRSIQSYVSNLKSFSCYKNWVKDFLIYFVLNFKSNYPNSVLVKSYQKNIRLLVWDHFDRMTVNEIFCWECYRYINKQDMVVLDLGGNIGLSAKYFLNKNCNNKVYVFEPNRSLGNYFSSQLSEYEDSRYFLDPRAIGTQDGKVALINSEHSRYNYIEYSDQPSNIEAISISQAINDCIKKFGKCDIIKIDIEGYGFLALNTIKINFKHKPSIIFIEEEFDQKLELNWLKMNYELNVNASGIYVFKKR